MVLDNWGAPYVQDFMAEVHHSEQDEDWRVLYKYHILVCLWLLSFRQSSRTGRACQSDFSCKCIVHAWLNPLTPKSDWHLISPHNFTLESNTKVPLKMKMITTLRSSLLLNKFSWTALTEMLREQYGEYAYWC